MPNIYMISLKVKKLKLSSAPSSVLNKVAKTVEIALKENKIGKVRLYLC